MLEHDIVVEDRLVALLAVGEFVWALFTAETCELRESDSYDAGLDEYHLVNCGIFLGHDAVFWVVVREEPWLHTFIEKVDEVSVLLDAEVL